MSSLADAVSGARVVAARLLAPPEPATPARTQADASAPRSEAHEDVADAAAAAIVAAAADAAAARGESAAVGAASKPGDVDERYKSF